MYRRDFLKRATAGAGGAAALMALYPLVRIAGAAGRGAGNPIRRAVRGMGTYIRFTVLPHGADRADAAIDAAVVQIETVDRLMSVHRPQSDLCRINRAPGGPVRVNSHTLTVAKAAQAYADLSDGALDPTVLPLMRYWGFMEEQDTVPRKRDPGSCLERVGYRQMLILDGAAGLRYSGGELDFGSIAKGYAVDRAVAQLRMRGIAHALIEAGGDLYAAGRPSPVRRWTIGIRDPQRPDRLFATVEAEDEAVATSGGYEKFLIIGGRRISHVIDPRTGQPAEDVISATILAPTVMEADALSTATCILGVKAAFDLVRQRPGVEGVWVTPDGSRWISPGLAGRIRWV